MGWGSSTWRGGDQKVRYVPRNPGNQTFLAGYPGILAGYPGSTRKVWEKNVWVQFSSPIKGDIWEWDFAMEFALDTSILTAVSEAIPQGKPSRQGKRRPDSTLCWKMPFKSRGNRKDKLKGQTEPNSQHFAGFRWFLQIFRFSWEFTAFRRRGFLQETADFRRKVQETADFRRNPSVPFSLSLLLPPY